MRSSWDLDILVQPEFLSRAVEVLKGLNYHNLFLKNTLTPKQWQYSVKHFHHFTFFDGDHCVELHWRLMHLEHLSGFKNDDLWQQPLQMVLGGETLQVPCNELDLAHLVAHGASHSFYRLGWLYDLEIFRQQHKNDFEGIYKFLASKGCAPLVQTAYACSAIAFGENGLPLDQVNLRFLGHFVKTVKNPASKNFKSVIFNEYLGKIMLIKGLGNKRKVLQIISTSPKDWGTLKLNDRLFFLYFVLRPFLMLFNKKRV
jgi:hypothetical protein